MILPWRRKLLWLVRSKRDGAKFCECKPGIVNAMYDDPQTGFAGGFGWMFTCINCRLGFDIATAQWLPCTLEQLAVRATPRIRKVIYPDGRMEEQILIASPEEWLSKVEPWRHGLVVGQDYVQLDGHLLPRQRGPVKFRGLRREHDLPDLPHLAPPPLSDILLSSSYWAGEPLEQVLREIEQERSS